MIAVRLVSRLSLLCALAALPLLGACGRSDLPTDTGGDGGILPVGDGGGPGGLVSISVDPSMATIALQTKATLVATGLYADGSKQDLTQAATWTTANPAVASVANGVVAAVGAGSTTVTAQVGGVTGSAQITVTKATVTSIAINPPEAQLTVGGMVALQAIALFSDGTKQDVTNVATWTSDNGSVASVSASGLVTGVSSGGVAVRATFNGVVGLAKIGVSGKMLVSIEITPSNPTVGPGIGFQFTAVAHYDDGSIQDVTQFAAWSSSAPMIVGVDKTGFANSLAPGVAIVSATLNGVSGTSTVTVTAAMLESITILTPNGVLLPVAGTIQLIAIGNYLGGAMADLTQSVTWSSDAPGTATVSNAMGSAGIVTGVAPGALNVSATLGKVVGTVALDVTKATLVGITLSPIDATQPLGTTIPYKAVGSFNDGSFADLTQDVTFSTDDPNVATISNAPGLNGVATTVGAGKTIVHAVFGGVSAQTTLTVTNASLLSVSIAPADSTMVLGDKQAMTATAHYSDGTSVDVTTTVVWTTLDQSVATISNAQGAAGLLTATGPGSTTVVATFMKLMGTTSVSVTAPKLTQIVVSPIDPTLPVGQNQQFQAVAIFSNNVSLNVTGMAAWSSSSVAVAKIGNNGRATTVAAGITTITATFMGLSGSTTLTVTKAVLVSIEVAPINSTMVAGAVQQFQATAIYSDNTSQQVTGQSTWLSSNPKVAAVSDGGFTKGRVTAVAAGTAQVSASYQGLTGSTTVTVSSAVVVSLSVAPAQLSVAAGTIRQYTCEAIYSDMTSKDVTTMATWLSSDGKVAGVGDGFGNKGVVTAIAAGSSIITCNFSGLSGGTTITVTSATVTSIEITPAQPSVAKGTPLQFQAVAIFSDNTSQNVTAGATWLSSDKAVAQVSDANGSKGATQTLAPGTATVSATWMGVTGTTLLTVTPATVVQIQVTPFAPTLPVGFGVALDAVAIFSDNTTEDVTLLATWISDAPNFAAVSDQGATKGRVTPIAPGTAHVTATWMAVTGSDTITVSNATLKSIAVAPPMVAIAVGQEEQFTATGSFSDGTMLDVTTFVTWQSSNPAIADVSNAGGSQGQAKGFADGSVNITATRGIVSGAATLLVQ